MTNPTPQPEETVRLSRQREAFLRFYAAMTNVDYDKVVEEYLGKSLRGGVYVNRLYRAVETAIHWMNQPESQEQNNNLELKP